MSESKKELWFVVTATGDVLTPCKNEAAAKRLATANDDFWPPDAPHRAVQLVDASEVEVLRSKHCELLQAIKDLAQAAAWREFGECRGFADGKPMPVATALGLARAAIKKAEGETQ